MRISGVVEHDEAGIGRLIAIPPGQNGARMAAQSRRRLEQRDPVRGRQKIGRRKPLDAAADDGHRAGADARVVKCHVRSVCL